MAQTSFRVDLRSPAEGVAALDLRGPITGAAEEALFAAHQAAGSRARVLILNLRDVEWIDSAGAGLLIALQARAQTQKQRLVAYSLGEVCRRALESTYLDTAIGLYADEAAALRAV